LPFGHASINALSTGLPTTSCSLQTPHTFFFLLSLAAGLRAKQRSAAVVAGLTGVQCAQPGSEAPRHESKQTSYKPCDVGKGATPGTEYQPNNRREMK
jgi:hypothetical protein